MLSGIGSLKQAPMSIARKDLSADQKAKLWKTTQRSALVRGLFRSDLIMLARLHGTDKWGTHQYARHYQTHFSHLRKRRLNLLEIGIGGEDRPDYGGHSLRMWKDYFPNANIHGLDIHDKSAFEEPRIKIFRGSQADPDFLKQVAAQIGRLDVIIDDGSHINEHVLASFQTLFPLLAENGIYAVEDLGSSYWPDWGGSQDPACETTSIAMCKRWIDGLNWEFIADREPHPFDRSMVELHFYKGLAIIQKGDNTWRSLKPGDPRGRPV